MKLQYHCTLKYSNPTPPPPLKMSCQSGLQNIPIQRPPPLKNELPVRLTITSYMEHISHFFSGNTPYNVTEFSHSYSETGAYKITVSANNVLGNTSLSYIISALYTCDVPFQMEDPGLAEYSGDPG